MTADVINSGELCRQELRRRAEERAQRRAQRRGPQPEPLIVTRRPAIVVGEVVHLPLTRGKTAIVDLIDAELGRFNWCAWPGEAGVWYARRTVRGKEISLHRVVAARAGLAINGLDVDHEDRDGLNCVRLNLRPASRDQNAHNARLSASNTSGFKGVSWHKDQDTWVARIRHKTQLIHLGNFRNKADAAQAYADAAVRLYGEFARLS